MSRARHCRRWRRSPRPRRRLPRRRSWYAAACRSCPRSRRTRRDRAESVSLSHGHRRGLGRAGRARGGADRRGCVEAGYDRPRGRGAHGSRSPSRAGPIRFAWTLRDERRSRCRTRTASPLRLIAPGWYGVASVKWLDRIEMRERALRGPLHGPGRRDRARGGGRRPEAGGGDLGWPRAAEVSARPGHPARRPLLHDTCNKVPSSITISPPAAIANQRQRSVASV